MFQNLYKFNMSKPVWGKGKLDIYWPGYVLQAIMKMSKVGNQTNSQDPQAVNSRVFVGNLNTFQCSKTDVERMFQRYGRLAGTSYVQSYKTENY
jgi:RNA recognition motif-containing protein